MLRFSSLLLPLARQWIAGSEYQDAIDRARETNEKGMQAIINLLGEDVSGEESVRHVSIESMQILDLLDSDAIESSISVKLTQLGLLLGKGSCLENVGRIVQSPYCLC